MTNDTFTHRVAIGWLRDLASEPTPHDLWPCIRWDDQLAADQVRFLDVQSAPGVDHNVVWGLFVDRAWPLTFDDVIDAERTDRLRAFVDAAHARGVKVMTGMGIYSWGFDEIIKHFPDVAAGHAHAMCPFKPAAWDWQRRVLDFVMEPRWGLDGMSMQSADQGRCTCDQCQKLSPAEHHALILTRSAEYVRAQRPDWVIGQASWGLRLDEPAEVPFIQHIATDVDYMVEVNEVPGRLTRAARIKQLSCAYGTLGGVFVEPPQHWDRLRWFVPCGLSSAGALKALWADGGRACEYFYRPFANPADEVSWRSGAGILANPRAEPMDCLKAALGAVYGVAGADAGALAEWYARAEQAYFGLSNFQVGSGPLSLEPLIWEENPAVSGPPVYLTQRLTAKAHAAYAGDLRALKAEFAAMRIPNDHAASRTLACIDGALADLASVV